MTVFNAGKKASLIYTNMHELNWNPLEEEVKKGHIYEDERPEADPSKNNGIECKLKKGRLTFNPTLSNNIGYTTNAVPFYLLNSLNISFMSSIFSVKFSWFSLLKVR